MWNNCSAVALKRATVLQLLQFKISSQNQEKTIQRCSATVATVPFPQLLYPYEGFEL
jgi:hypothetical protein